MTSSAEPNAGGPASSRSRSGTAPPFGQGGGPASAWSRPLGHRLTEQVIQVAVEGMRDDRAHGVEGALLGVARRARVPQDVVGDAVYVRRVSLDLLGLLVELRRALAETVLYVAVLVDVGELLRDADVAQ